MAARRLCCPPAIVLPLSFRSFSPPNLRGRLADRHSPNFAARSMVTQIYEIRSEIWMAPSPRNLAAKNIKIQLRDLIANISGMQQDIVNRKTELQTTDTPTQKT